MDKYEFNIKVEQIKKMVSRGAVSYTHLDVYKRQVPGKGTDTVHEGTQETDSAGKVLPAYKSL